MGDDPVIIHTDNELADELATRGMRAAIDAAGVSKNEYCTTHAITPVGA